MGGPAGGESCWLGSTPDHEQVAGQGLHEGEAGQGRGLQERAELAFEVSLSLTDEPERGGRPLRQQGRERFGGQWAHPSGWGGGFGAGEIQTGQLGGVEQGLGMGSGFTAGSGVAWL